MLTKKLLHDLYQEVDNLDSVWRRDHKKSATGVTYQISHQLLGLFLIAFNKTGEGK
jgi:hypothetical protein